MRLRKGHVVEVCDIEHPHAAVAAMTAQDRPRLPRRRLVAALLVLVVAAAVTLLTITRAFGVLSSTTSNANNAFSASTCYLPVPVSMVSGNQFSPTSLTIKAGCSIKWTNTTSQSHNTTSDTSVWVSQDPMVLNATFTYQFTSVGSYPYKCTRHGGMTATITVN